MAAKPYHHGALRPALLEAAETMLERDGLDRLSFRAISRAAGVSHAAAGYHFGDLRGLLTALATVGFQRFARILIEAQAGSADPLRALGRAYVRFAQTQPRLFLLMFHHAVLDGDDAAFRAATVEAFAALAQVAAARSSGSDADASGGRPLASWCLVHGFAMLLLDGRLPSEPGAEALLEAILA